MANGIVITETAHGFVCANGGIDASNVGSEGGSIVTLLPDDPDASAARIRAAVRDTSGVDVPVVVSDIVRPALAVRASSTSRSGSRVSCRSTTCGARPITTAA